MVLPTSDKVLRIPASFLFLYFYFFINEVEIIIFFK